MNPLISSIDLSRIENQLLLRRNQLAEATSWTFNMAILLFVLGTFVYFLYAQYTSNQVATEEEKRIPFEPTTWYSATRNVRSEEYGRQLQPFEAQTGYGIPRPIDGEGTGTLFGTAQ